MCRFKEGLKRCTAASLKGSSHISIRPVAHRPRLPQKWLQLADFFVYGPRPGRVNVPDSCSPRKNPGLAGFPIYPYHAQQLHELLVVIQSTQGSTNPRHRLEGTGS